MRRGIDTTFLVQTEVAEHPGHADARTCLSQLVDTGDTLVLAPQVLTEFIHIVSDPRRFSAPLSVAHATDRATLWWTASEVAHAFPSAESVSLALRWLSEHQLGRKRLLDTHLAATYFCHGLRSIVSSNTRDFSVFGCFDVIRPC